MGDEVENELAQHRLDKEKRVETPMERHVKAQKIAEGAAITLPTNVLVGFANLDGKAKRILEQCLASGEPFIVFRAKDIFTPMVVSHYLGLLEETFGHNNNIEQQESLTEWRDKVVAWQRANAHRVRYPD